MCISSSTDRTCTLKGVWSPASMSMADKCLQVNGVRHVFCCARSSEQSTCNCFATLLWTNTVEHKPEPSDTQKTHPSATGSGVTLAPGVIVKGDAIHISFVRSSGPGGQNVNKRSTKAQLRIAIDDLPLSDRARVRLLRLGRSMINSQGELLLSSDETRSQSRNRRACMDRLREIIMRAIIEPKARKATKPTRGSVRRRLEEKKQRSQTKQRRRPPDQS